jgi:hypothetical protein
MEGVALRLRHDELGALVAEQLATAGAIILGRRRHESCRCVAEPELCSGHAIEPRSPSSPKCPVEGPLAAYQVKSRRPGSRRSAGLRRPPFIHHEHLVARSTRASVIGEPPIGRNVVSAGSRSSASSTARSSSAGDPNGHLDLAPDRRLADLELSGADRAALAQCAEFGQ